MLSTICPCPTPWRRYRVPVHVLGRDSERRPAQPRHQARVEDDQVSVLPTLHASGLHLMCGYSQVVCMPNCQCPTSAFTPCLLVPCLLVRRWLCTSRQRFVANNLVVVPGVGEACLASIYDDITAHGLPVRGWEGEVEEAGGLGHGAAHRAASAMRAVATATAPPVRALCAAFTSVSNVVSAGAADVMRSLRGFL